eukprot:Partr_v1_DN27801_c0_g1_i1_m22657 putative Monoglyceride lipase
MVADRRNFPLTAPELQLHNEPNIRVISQALKSPLNQCIQSYTFIPLNTNHPRPGQAVIIAHGLGDYGGRQIPIVKSYLDAGYVTCVYDQPGHGRSSGVHGLVESPAQLVAALDAVIDHLDGPVVRDVAFPSLSAEEHVQIFVVGESMGATAAVLHAIDVGDGRVKAIVCVAGAFKVSPESRPNAVLRSIANSLNYFWPSLPASPAYRGQLHWNGEYEDEFNHDPYSYSGWLRLGTGVSFMHAFDKIERCGGDIDTPILFLHGDHDRVADLDGCRELLERLGDKRSRLH